METRTVHEYEALCLPVNAWALEDAQRFTAQYGDKFDVQPPHLYGDRQWQLKSQGCIGSLQLSGDLCLVVEPKVSVQSVFRMLEYAYTEARFWDRTVPVGTISELLQSLAIVLAERVSVRARRGLSRAYDPRHEASPVVRGRIDLAGQVRRPWQVAIACHYQEYTDNILENQALAYTLRLILRSGICDNRARHIVRHGYQAVRALLPERTLCAADLTPLLFTRLNADYQPMLALCRFFLDHLGAEHLAGAHDTLSFLIEMPKLFELFVARWLQRNLPGGWRVQEQHTLQLGRSAESDLSFRPDLVLWRANQASPVAIWDTKYKAVATIRADDIAQVVAYATAYGCHEAALIYPQTIARPPIMVGDVTVRFLAFDLAQDIEAAGASLLDQLLQFASPCA